MDEKVHGRRSFFDENIWSFEDEALVNDGKNEEWSIKESLGSFQELFRGGKVSNELWKALKCQVKKCYKEFLANRRSSLFGRFFKGSTLIMTQIYEKLL